MIFGLSVIAACIYQPVIAQAIVIGTTLLVILN